MLTTLVRAIWSLVVVCLVAASGVQSPRTTRSDRHDDTQLGDQRAAMLAVTATRAARAHAAPRATRPRPPVFVLTAPPEAPRLSARAIAGSVRHARAREAALAPIRAARGPPAR
jgi:hypothetical protein